MTIELEDVGDSGNRGNYFILYKDYHDIERRNGMITQIDRKELLDLYKQIVRMLKI